MIPYENELAKINSSSFKNFFFFLAIRVITNLAENKSKRNSDIKNHTYYYLDHIVTVNENDFIEIIFDQKSLENIYCHEYRVIYCIKPLYIIF